MDAVATAHHWSFRRGTRFNQYVPANASLHQPQSLQARVPVLADDDVIVHGDAE